MSDKYKKKEDGEVSGEDDDYKSSKQRKTDKDDRKKSKKSSRSQSSRRTSDKTNDLKSSKKDKDHKDSSRRRSSKSRSKDRKEQSKRKNSRSRSRSYHNDRNGTNPKRDKDRDVGKDKDRKRSKSPTKDKDRKKDDRRRSKSPKSSNNGKRKSSRSKSPKREDKPRDKDQKPSNRDNEKRSNQTNNKDKERESRRSEEKEYKQLTLEEQEERNERYYNQFDDSDSEYYQKANERKYKSSRRSRSKSKNRDRRRSYSKKRDRDDKDKDKEKNKNNTNGDKKSKSTRDKKQEETKESKSIPIPIVQDDLDDEYLDMELEENSEDERERKKQEFLNMMKGLQKTTENNTLQSNNNIDSQINTSASKNQQEQQNDQNQNDEEVKKNLIDNFADDDNDEQLYDNTGINPNDALDDDDDNNQGNQINDDYKEEGDQLQNQPHRHSFDKAQLDHLKYLEDLRNQEIKGGIPDILDESQPVLQQRRRSSKQEYLERKFSNKDQMVDEYGENKLHKLDEDQLSEDETDMFGDDIDKIINKNNDGKLQIVKGANAECDDEQNYFKILIGEVLQGKYRVVSKCGKGVFANVCKAEQLDNGKLVAIKILRSNEIMHESGEHEKEIIQKLNLTDKNDRKHIVRLKNVFEHQKHLCLVFECFAMNLRDALKEYGKGKGFSLDVVRSYAYQIFVALTHLKKNGYIHADLKPDNLLISDDTKTLKMCDFGTALSIEENGIIKYIQSRFYRAPEVLIGYPPYTSIDVWSIGVTLYEIYTQKILFDGSTNNEMLKLIMDARGKFNKKMLQIGNFVSEYFDQNYTFKYMQIDPQTKQKYITPITYGDIPKKDITKLLQETKEGIHLENQKKLSQFKDFLDKCLQLDPKNRITPEDALEHPFLKLNTAKPTK